jgi:WD40 repeat protein
MGRQATTHSEDGAREVLEAYRRALRREAHVLADRPELTFQQLYNRLQWEDGAIEERLAPERRRRSRPGERPWVRIRTPYWESKALVRTLVAGDPWVGICAFSPDGALIVSAANDELRVWETRTGNQLASLSGHRNPVNGCAFSPDGALIVSAANDELRVWQASTGACTNALAGGASDCAFSPDGSRIVSVGGDGTLRTWEVESGTELSAVAGSGGQVNAFSPDGSRIVSANKGTLTIWRAETGEPLHTMAGDRQLYDCAFSPDGTRAVSASEDATLKLWDAETGEALHTLGDVSWTGGHTDIVRACAFSPDGARVVSASEDTTLKLWDAETGEEMHTVAGYTDYALDCAVSPDGALIASASSDGTLKIWDARSDLHLRDPERHGGEVHACAFSPDGKRIVSGSAQDDPLQPRPGDPLFGFGNLKVWDAETGREVHNLLHHTDYVEGCAFSPDGKHIVSASSDKSLIVWDATSGKQLRALSGHENGVRSCAFHPAGHRIVSASSDGTLKLWDAAAGGNWAQDQSPGDGPRTLRGHLGPVQSCEFSPDGSRIVSAGGEEVKMWDVETGDCIATLPGYTTCAFSPDGSSVVSAAADGTVRVWDVATRSELVTLDDGAGYCRFSPNGQRIVSNVSGDGTFRIWDAGSGLGIGTLSFPFPYRVLAGATHPWLDRLACGDQAGAVCILDFVGFERGPTIVTAEEHDRRPVIRCPACWRQRSLAPDQLGSEIACPTPSCGLELRVNPFVIATP